ncbi:MAG: 4-hydroxy-tetrahydrodipicolinate reductase [Desulfobacterales bacterium]
MAHVAKNEIDRSIKVVVNGALGRAGKTTIDILCREPGIEIVGVVDVLISKKNFPLPDGSGQVLSSSNLEQVLNACKPDVLVDFTEPLATMTAVELASKKGIHIVIGTTGLTDDQLNKIDELTKAAGVGALTGTLSFGIALVSRLAALASKYFEYAEIVDLGKMKKLDAPSQAALDFAQAMLKARGKPFKLPPVQTDVSASRGGQYHGATIHSLRLSDCYLHEKITFGAPEGTLVTVGVELTSEAYLYPGIVVAIEKAGIHKGLVYGFDDLLLDAINEKIRKAE